MMQPLKNKTPVNIALQGLSRGTERIRTAVNGFADHRLATRPRYLFGKTDGKSNNF